MTVGLGLAVVAALILANALFVAAEFALVASRRQVVEDLASRGSRRARAALHEMRRLSFMLSGAQFGITVSSLVLGYVAADALGGLLAPVAGLLPGGDAATVVVLAVLVSSVLQMIAGELAPKNLAIARPEPTALLTAIPMRAYSIVFGPVIRLFDSSANWLSRRLGVEPPEELLAAYSPDELARIIEASGEEGALSDEQAALLLRAVELGERRVTEVMVPRPDVTFLAADAPLAALREATRRTGHSRFPVRGASEDDVLGTVHIKDLLDVPPESLATAAVADLATAALIVPENHSLRGTLAQLRREGRTFAVVVDEFGGVAGIVTIEDLLEALVGAIEDEFDPRTSAVRRLGPGRFVVLGRMRVGDVERFLGTEFEEGEYETIAGLVLDRLGRIPEEGDAVVEVGWRLTVRRMDGNRIAELVLAPTAEAVAP
ncbi:MAG: hemolysin family protein [Nitriliruptorales bacterium]